MHLFAAKQSDLMPAMIVAGGAGIALALLVAALVHAGCLMLACRGARVRAVGYRRAFLTVLLCHSTLFGFVAVMAIGIGLSMQGQGPTEMRSIALYIVSPINYVYLFAFGVLVHVAVFAQRVGEPDDPPLGFGPATALAVIYLGWCGLASSILWVAFTAIRSLL
ncbi:hypothetical protein [Tuwongella immobilis]|nr:hypothetical protein [Tuwongella immobilis]